MPVLITALTAVLLELVPAKPALVPTAIQGNPVGPLLEPVPAKPALVPTVIQGNPVGPPSVTRRCPYLAFRIFTDNCHGVVDGHHVRRLLLTSHRICLVSLLVSAKHIRRLPYLAFDDIAQMKASHALDRPGRNSSNSGGVSVYNCNRVHSYSASPSLPCLRSYFGALEW